MEIFKKLSEVDIKSISIIFLVIISLILGYGWINGDTSSSKLIKRIELENEKIEKEKDILKKEIVKSQDRVRDLEKDIEFRDNTILILDNKIKEIDKKLKTANYELSKEKKVKLEIEKKIKEIEENPIKREGSSLIESLRSKTK